MTDAITVTVGDAIYAGWTDITINRAIDRMATSFDLQVTERWDSQNSVWSIHPGQKIVLRIGNDVVLTGYANTYRAGCDGHAHTVNVSGRGKTQDLIDCMPDIPGGQFSNYDLVQIARALSAPFGIDVISTLASSPKPESVTIQRTETAFQFIERLARLSSVLVTDDEQGRLVLTTVSQKRATDAILMGPGGNVIRAEADLNDSRRFSTYIMKRQDGATTGGPSDNLFQLIGTDAASPPAVAASAPQRYTAIDPSIARYRPHVSIAEVALDSSGMMERVQWQARYAAAKSVKVTVELPGFRQSDGALWKCNQMVGCNLPYLGIDQDLFIAGISYRQSRSGSTASLVLGPPDSYTPDPGQIRRSKVKGGGAGGVGYDGFGT